MQAVTNIHDLSILSIVKKSKLDKIMNGEDKNATNFQQDRCGWRRRQYRAMEGAETETTSALAIEKALTQSTLAIRAHWKINERTPYNPFSGSKTASSHKCHH